MKVRHRSGRPRYLRAAIVLGAVALAVGAVVTVGVAVFLDRSSRTLAIGDSLTHGALASPGHRWVDILHVNEQGRNGFTSADAAAYPWVIPSSIDVVLVEFGVNDYLRGVPSKVFETNMAMLLARLTPRVILIAAPAPLDPRDSVEPWGNYVAAMRRLGQVVDVGTFGPDLFTADGVHPNDAGHAVMAEIIGKALAVP